jgi:hypothetical protein
MSSLVSEGHPVSQEVADYRIYTLDKLCNLSRLEDEAAEVKESSVASGSMDL